MIGIVHYTKTNASQKETKKGGKQMITIAEFFFWPVLDDDDGVDDYENDGNRKWNIYMSRNESQVFEMAAIGKWQRRRRMTKPK